MRSMNFQWEEGKIWSHMTLITFSARQLHNLSDQMMDTLTQKQSVTRQLQNHREETLDTQSASNNYLATLEEQLISRHLTLVFQNSITGPVPRLQ